MRVLLVKPPFNGYTFIQHFAVCEPLEFEVLATVLVEHYDVRVVDLRVDPRPLPDHLDEFDPHVVGFTALTMDVNTVRDLARQTKIRLPGAIVCVGGEHASLQADDFNVPEIDFVFRYDATTTFPRLLGEIEGLRRSGRPLISANRGAKVITNEALSDDLATQRLPRRELTHRYLHRYTFGCANPVSLVQTTAGCAFRCTYCSIPARHPKYQQRHVDAILTDLTSIQTTDVLSIDANALQDLKTATVLYQEIGRARLGRRLMISCRSDTVARHPEILPVLRDAGVAVIAFGLETMDSEKLKAYNKRNNAQHNEAAVQLAHQFGFLVRGNFIIDQRFTADDFQRLIEYVIASGIEFPTFQILTPLPGTPFYEEKKSELLTGNFDFFDLSHSVLSTELPLEEFHTQFRRLFRECYGVRRLLWLTTRVPLIAAAKGLVIAARSHITFSYSGQLSGLRRERLAGNSAP